jgi:hypothetical protein
LVLGLIQIPGSLESNPDQTQIQQVLNPTLKNIHSTQIQWVFWFFFGFENPDPMDHRVKIKILAHLLSKRLNFLFIYTIA